MTTETPPYSWRDQVTGTTAGYVKALASSGLLTKKQALAYVLREVYSVSRDDAAADMGVTTSTVDKHLSAAREKVAHARATVDHLDRIEQRESDDSADEAGVVDEAEAVEELGGGASMDIPDEEGPN